MPFQWFPVFAYLQKFNPGMFVKIKEMKSLITITDLVSKYMKVGISMHIILGYL